MIHFLTPQYLYLLAAIPIVAGAALASGALQTLRARFASAAVRSLILSAVVLALARPVTEHAESHDIHPVFVFVNDASRSTDLSEADARAIQDRLTRALPAEAATKSIYFAASPATTLGPDSPRRNATNIEDALDFAMATAAQSRNTHLVLVSDGRSTAGNPVSAAARIRDAGGDVSTVPIGRVTTGSPAIVDIQPPEDARVGLAAHVLARVRFPRPTDAAIALLAADGREMSSITTHIDSEQEVALPVQPLRRGLHRMRVVASDAANSTAPAASGEAAFYVSGPPAVLICDPDPISAQPLKNVLEQLKFAVKIEPPSELAPTDESLSEYDAVILSDWPAPDTSGAALARLRRFIDDGGCLVFLGGARVSTKSWRGSALEALLPIDFAPEIVRMIENPVPVHVCFVLDVSGSMMGVLGVDAAGQPVTKFNMMKQAVLDSLGELPATAIVSLITFSDGYQVVLNRVPIANRRKIVQTVRDIQIGGGTNMVPAIRTATEMLTSSRVSRFMILLTDGNSAQNPNEALRRRIRDADIDLTAIAVGADANISVMQALANSTYGRYVYCGDAGSIPRVFVRQARAIKSLSVMPRRPFEPKPGPQPEMLHGLATGPWPILEAALPAAPKPDPGVEVPLITDVNQPLLASWPMGLGRVVAFLSDAKPAWARRWLQWPQYERFWARILSAALTRSADYRTQVDVHAEYNQCIALVAVRTADGRLTDDVSPTGSLHPDTAGPASASAPAPKPFEWKKLPSGIFRGTAPIKPDERYICDLDFRTNANRRILRWEGVVGSPPDLESTQTGPDRAALKAIASAGNGKFDPTPDDLAEIAARPVRETLTVARPLWPWLVSLAILLWPVDIACRKFGTL